MAQNSKGARKKCRKKKVSLLPSPSQLELLPRGRHCFLLFSSIMPWIILCTYRPVHTLMSAFVFLFFVFFLSKHAHGSTPCFFHLTINPENFQGSFKNSLTGPSLADQPSDGLPSILRIKSRLPQGAL